MESSVDIGVDVSQAALDIATEGDSKVLKIANAARAIRPWLAGLPPRCRIAVESTGQLHLALVRAAIAAGHTVYVLNARDLSYYARSLGRRAKTDQLDALLIARYLKHEHENLHPYQLPSELQVQLTELIRQRHNLVVERQARRQSFATCSCKLRSAARLMRAFDAGISEIEERLQSLINQDPALRVHAQHLRTVVGFGPLLSASLAQTITRLPFKNAYAFIAYIGYDPRPRDSGQLRGRRYLIKRGPAEIRRLLFTAAMSACKSKLWQPLYQRYRARGFCSTAALVILARKLARIAFAIVRQGVAFQPQRVQTACVQP